MTALVLKLTTRTSTPRPPRVHAAEAQAAVLTATQRMQRLAVLQSRLQMRRVLRQLPAQTDTQGSGVRRKLHRVLWFAHMVHTDTEACRRCGRRP